MTSPSYRLWSQADLNWMRTVQNAQLVDSCVINRITSTPNGEGGYTESFATSTTTCRLHIVSKKIGNVGEAHIWGSHEVQEAGLMVTLPWGTDVRVNDKLTVTSTETGATGTYGIISLDNLESTSTAVRCRVEAIR